ATLSLPSRVATYERGSLADAVLAGQLAASLVLVVGAALFARTLWNLDHASGGFDRRTVVYAVPNFGGLAQIPRDLSPRIMADVLERLKQSPLMAAVSMGTPPMVWGSSGFSFVTRVGNYTIGPDEDNTVYDEGVLPGFFDVLKIPLIAG